ncbi:hypothetical protein EZS27_044473, partial [termite gut metagenome]
NLNSSDSEGAFAVTSKTILDALKELPEQPLDFIVDFETYAITVKYQNGVYSLPGQNADEFPQLTTVGNDAVHLNIELKAGNMVPKPIPNIMEMQKKNTSVNCG